MDQLLELVVSGWTPFYSPLVAFILTSLIIEMTPGPNMAYLAVLGASRGRLAGFFAVLGVALGLALLGIAVGLGGGSLVMNNRVAYESLRWAGALYLCWLAFDSWREARRPIEAVPVGPISLHPFSSRLRHQSSEPEGGVVLHCRASRIHPRPGALGTS